jgi:hypothetical protein
LVPHPSHYCQDKELDGHSGHAPLNLSFKGSSCLKVEFCICLECKLGGYRGCIGETASGITRHRYKSGYVVHTFICDPCSEKLYNSQKPRCGCCDSNTGLLRRAVGGQWTHYTCALTNPNIKILSLKEMKFEFLDEQDALNIRGTDTKKTRSKRTHQESQSFYSVFRSQAIQIINKTKDTDDSSFQAYKFLLGSKEATQQDPTESPEFEDELEALVQFSPGPRARKGDKNPRNNEAAEAREQVNVSEIFGVESKEAFREQLQGYSKAREEKSIRNELQERFAMGVYAAEAPDKPSNYCRCQLNKEVEVNFVLCDECQIWYHCECIGVDLEKINDNESFICRKCRTMRVLDSASTRTAEEALKLKKERLLLDEMIFLSVAIEDIISNTDNADHLASLDFTIVDLSSAVNSRRASLLIRDYLIQLGQNIMEAFDLNNLYTENGFNLSEIERAKTLISNLRTVEKVIQSQKGPEGHQFRTRLKEMALIAQYCDELQEKIIRIPAVLQLAKEIEAMEGLRNLRVHKDLLAAFANVQANLRVIREDFKKFQVEATKKMKANDLVGLQAVKLGNERLKVYKEGLGDNRLAWVLMESLLAEMEITESERNREIPIKFDYFILALKKEMKCLLGLGESELAKTWLDKQPLLEKSKLVIQKISKLKSELPQWRDISELKAPEEVLATKLEVDTLLEEAEDSILMMNSSAVRKLVELKSQSSKFEKKVAADNWGTFENCKRYVFGFIKGGVLCTDEVVKMVQELKNHSLIVKFCNNREFFTLEELEGIIASSEKRFEQEYYDKAVLLLEEIRRFYTKASVFQKEGDVWKDVRLDECLQIYKKLTDYKIQMPVELDLFVSISKSIEWLLEIAEMSGLEFDRTIGLAHLKYRFEDMLNKLLGAENLFDNLNFRALAKIERRYFNRVLNQNGRVFELYKRFVKRIWFKEWTELDVYNQGINHDDLRFLLRKWENINEGLETLPEPVQPFIAGLKLFREKLEAIVQEPGRILCSDHQSLQELKNWLEPLSSFNLVHAQEGIISDGIYIGSSILHFAVKTHLAVMFLDPSAANHQGQGMDAIQLQNLYNLLCKVLANYQINLVGEDNRLLCKATWAEDFAKLNKAFGERYKENQELSRRIESFLDRSERCKNDMETLKKTTKISLPIILHEMTKRPTYDETEAIVSTYKRLNLASDENREILVEYMEDALSIIKALNHCLDKHGLQFNQSDENIKRFQTFEKDFLRLLKKLEVLPIYAPKMKPMFLALYVHYKVFKLFSEEGNQKKWSKTRSSIDEILKEDPEIEAIGNTADVLSEFDSQYQCISSLTDKLLQNHLVMKEVLELQRICEEILVENLGDVEIGKLKEECTELASNFTKAHEASSQNKIAVDTFEILKKKLDRFRLTVSDPEVDALLKTFFSHKKLLKVLNLFNKEGMNNNGYVAEFILKRYQESPIFLKTLEDLLAVRTHAMAQYENIENCLANLGDESFNETEYKLSRLKLVFNEKDKMIKLKSWIRKVHALKQNQISVSYTNLECLYSDGFCFLERSKKYLPVDQKTLAEIIYHEVLFLEELLKVADTFIEKIAGCTSVKELESMIPKLKEKERLDLSEIIIDFKTQLSMKSIEFSKTRRNYYSDAVKQVQGHDQIGQREWNLSQAFVAIDQLFGKNIALESQIFEKKLLSIMEGDEHLLNNEYHNIVQEAARDEEIREEYLGKRRARSGLATASLPQKKLETGNKPFEKDNFVSNIGLGNLSYSVKDEDEITDSFREFVVKQLTTILKEGDTHKTDPSEFKNGAKNIEMHLFSRDYKSKSGYLRNLTNLRMLLEKILKYKSISKDLVSSGYNYDKMMQYSEKSDQKLLLMESDLHNMENKRYNPLGSFIGENHAGAKHKKKTLLLELSSSDNKDLISDLNKKILKNLDRTTGDPEARKSNLLRALDSQFKETVSQLEAEAFVERSVSRSSKHRSRSQSRKRKSHKEKKKDKKKDKKKHRKEINAKFSSESESEEKQEADPSEEGTSSKSKFKAEGQREKNVMKEALGENQLRCWRRLEYEQKNKIRIYFSEEKKQANEGYSIRCNLYTSEPLERIVQFSEFSKVPTFIFDKYTKEIADIEEYYLAKMKKHAKHPMEPETNTIITGWIVPDETDPKEKKKLAHLENYLGKENKFLTYQVAAGVIMNVTLGKCLRNETLRQIQLKTDYDGQKELIVDETLVFFLKKSLDKEEKTAKRMGVQVVQEYDQIREKSMKLVYGERNEQSATDKQVRGHRRKDGIEDEKKRAEGKDRKRGRTDEQADDGSLNELLELFKGLDSTGVKDLVKSISDKQLKDKLYNIIHQYFPKFSYIIGELDQHEQTQANVHNVPQPVHSMPIVPSPFPANEQNIPGRPPAPFYPPVQNLPLNQPPPPPPAKKFSAPNQPLPYPHGMMAHPGYGAHPGMHPMMNPFGMKHPMMYPPRTNQPLPNPNYAPMGMHPMAGHMQPAHGMLPHGHMPPQMPPGGMMGYQMPGSNMHMMYPYAMNAAKQPPMGGPGTGGAENNGEAPEGQNNK